MTRHLRVSIHQPAYLPNGAFFAKLLSSDLHLVLDTVLFSRQSFQTRNRIRGPQGEMWLSVPVHGRKPPPLGELMVDNRTNWPARHWRTVVTVYGKKRTAELGWIRQLHHERFVDVATASLACLCALLEIDVPIRRASELIPDTASQDADQRLIDLMRTTGGDEYVSGLGGYNYMDLSRWHEAGISTTLCDWTPLRYPQEPHDDFLPSLSAIDIIARMGPSAARDLIQRGTALREL